ADVVAPDDVGGHVGQDKPEAGVAANDVAGPRRADGVTVPSGNGHADAIGESGRARGIRADEIALQHHAIRLAIDANPDVRIAGNDIACGGRGAADGDVGLDAVHLDAGRVGKGSHAVAGDADEVAGDDIVVGERVGEDSAVEGADDADALAHVAGDDVAVRWV